MVDLHTHILPGMDDGAKNVDESLRLIRMEMEQGVDSVAVTPHFHCEEEKPADFAARRNAAMKKLEEGLQKARITMPILPGAEVYATPRLLDISDYSPLCYRGTRYMLVELPTIRYSEWIPEVFYRLKLHNITPILAHAERYPYYAEKVENLYKLVASGVLVQVNAGSVVRSKTTRNIIYRYLKLNLVHLIASDTHSVLQRPPNVGQARTILQHRYGSSLTGYLAINSDAIAENIIPEIYDPIAPRKWIF